MSFFTQAILTILFGIATFGLLVNTTYAYYIVGADSDNKIILPIKNKNDSVGKMENVKVVVSKKPSFVTSASVSPSGVTINKGAKRDFTINFHVEDCAMHGQTGDIELKLEATPEDDYGIAPEPKKFLKKVPLKVEEVSPETSLSGYHWNILEIKIYDCRDNLIYFSLS